MKSNRHAWLLLLCVFAAFVVLAGAVFAATKPGTASRSVAKVTYPDNMFDVQYHDVGQLYLPLTNYGIHGHEVSTGSAGGVWPKGSGQTYIFGAGIWVGAIKGGNTYVTCGYNPNSGQSEIVPGWVYDPTHNYTNVTDPETGQPLDGSDVRVLMSTDYPYNMEELDLPDWPFGYYNPDTGDTVATWAEAGEDYVPVTVSVQDSYAWFSDVDQTYKFDSGADINNVFITQTGYAWNYFFNQDFVFLTFDVEYRNPEPGNAALDTLRDVYLSVTCDPDIGDAADDMVGFDADHNMAFVYDFDGRETGWSTTPGYLGYDFLESPIDPTSGEQMGLTAFRIFTIDVDPNNDVERYETISADGTFDVDTSPADKRFTMPTGPFDLATGESKRVVVAMLCARDFNALLGASELAQDMYDQGWASPTPPPEPILSAAPAAGQITLYWDDKAETYIDPVSNEADFEGYRIYKSRTGIGPLGNWNPADPTTEWQVIAQYDLVNEITNNTAINPEDMYDSNHPDDKYLGEDTGIVHMYVDTDVLDGVEYHYAVTAYDQGTSGLRSLECGLILGKNRIMAAPGLSRLGYQPAEATVVHSAGHSTADLPQAVLADPTLVKNETYTVTFDDTTYEELRFSVSNSAGVKLIEDSDYFDASGLLFIDGLDLFVYSEPVSGMKETVWTDASLEKGTSDVNWELTKALTLIDPRFDEYQFRFVADSSEYTKCTFPPTLYLPFQIWNVATEEQARVSIFVNSPDDTTDEMRNRWTSGDELTLMETYGGNPMKFTWKFILSAPDGPTVDPAPGDILRVVMARQQSTEDVYTITTTAATAEVKSEAALKDIKVVPNPYVVRNVWETSPDYSKIMFTHLPDQCTIRIYTMAGDLIGTLEHGDGEDEGPGYEWWDVLTENDQKVASGVYIYHIDAPNIGERVSKFAVIK